MDDKQENKNTEITNLLAFRIKYQAEIAVNEALVDSFTKLTGLQASVSSKNQFVLGGKKGGTLNKAKAREDLVIPGVVLTGAVFSLGHDTDNFDLQTRASITESDIRDGIRDTDLPDVLEGLLNEANLKVEEMAKYTITPEFLLDFSGKIAAFKNTIGNKTTQANAVKLASDAIDDLQRQQSEIIRKEIDKKMQPFRLTNPQIYDEYLLARRLPSDGIRHEDTEETPASTPDTTPSGEAGGN